MQPNGDDSNQQPTVIQPSNKRRRIEAMIPASHSVRRAPQDQDENDEFNGARMDESIRSYFKGTVDVLFIKYTANSGHASYNCLAMAKMAFLFL